MGKIEIGLSAFALFFLIAGTFATSTTNSPIDTAARDEIELAQHRTLSGEDCNQCSIGKSDKYPENLSSQIAQLEKDIRALDEEIKTERKRLKDLYKMAESTEDVWNEIYQIKWDIESLNREKALKKDRMIALTVFQEFTKKGDNGEIVILMEVIQPVDSLEISRARAFLEESCRDLSSKGEELEQLFMRARKGESSWNKIRKVEEEIELAEIVAWQRGDEYVRLSAVKELSEGKNIIFSECSSPDPFLPNGTHGFSSFVKTNVRVGIYDTDEPDIDHMIDQFCTSYFTTSMTYYWNIAQNRDQDTESIQIKWFYTATCDYDEETHDLIWEGNKNATTEWYTYASYDTTNPSNDDYEIICYSSGGVCQRYLSCCGGPLYRWCNTHCGLCFACDVDATQHFVTENP